MDNLVDIAFLVAIVGFVKEQFSLEGKWVVLVAFVVGAVLYFSPQIMALSPVAGQILMYLKWYLGAMGSFDVTVDVVSRAGTRYS